ncbi:MAG: hypothetical protein ABS876_09240, partial [Ruminococcus sp.]
AAVSKTACRGFKSFCPCHDDGLKNGLNKPFLRLFFLFLTFAEAANVSKILGLGFIWGLPLPNHAVIYRELQRLFALNYIFVFLLLSHKKPLSRSAAVFLRYSACGRLLLLLRKNIFDLFSRGVIG